MGHRPNHTCKVCGKRYFACPDANKYSSWRAVACSPSCYTKYMEQVNSPTVTMTKKRKSTKKIEQT